MAEAEHKIDRFYAKIAEKCSPALLLVLVAVVSVGISVQRIADHTQLNNFSIFYYSYDILCACNNLYVKHRFFFDNIYRYSPTFAFFMGVFVGMPTWLGVICWNLLNTLVLFTGLFKVISLRLDNKLYLGVTLLVLAEWITSIQNLQSNALIAGLILWGWFFLQKEKVWKAALMFALSAFVKFYGLAMAVLFLLYPRKGAFMLAGIVWALLFALLPLIDISAICLWMEYKEWFKEIVNAKAEAQLSLMGFIGKISNNPDLPFQGISLTGLCLTLLPFLRVRLYKVLDFQVLLFASLMAFLVVFNQMAESPTYIITVCGFAIWACSYTVVKLETRAYIIVLVLLFTSLSTSDIFPEILRKGLFVPYKIKMLPCLAFWLYLQLEIWKMKRLS